MSTTFQTFKDNFYRAVRKQIFAASNIKDQLTNIIRTAKQKNYLGNKYFRGPGNKYRIIFDQTMEAERHQDLFQRLGKAAGKTAVKVGITLLVNQSRLSIW